MGDELPALRVGERGRHRHLDAELIGAMRLALADAFHLGRVQRIDPRDGARGQALWATLVLALAAHPEGQRQRFGEDPAQALVTPGLADDAAEHPAEIGA